MAVGGAGGFAANLTFSLSQAENQFGGTTRSMIDTAVGLVAESERSVRSMKETEEVAL